MSVIALYQLGILKDVPEPSLPGIASDKYHWISQGLFAPRNARCRSGHAELCGDDDPRCDGTGGSGRPPACIPLAHGGKGWIRCRCWLLNIRFDERQGHRALCFWCVLASVATFASVPFAIPEACRAFRQLR